MFVSKSFNTGKCKLVLRSLSVQAYCAAQYLLSCALAAAAAREAAMRVAFLCLAHRALTPLRFTEPSVSPTSAPRPFAPGRTLLLGGDAPRAARRRLYRRSLSCPARRPRRRSRLPRPCEAARLSRGSVLAHECTDGAVLAPHLFITIAACCGVGGGSTDAQQAVARARRKTTGRQCMS